MLTLIILMIIELFPAYFMMLKIVKIVFESIKILWGYIINKSVEDIKFRNRFSSVLYTIIDIGPSVSAFAPVAIIISSKENASVLTIVFFAGIIIKEAGREFKNAFYAEITKRSSK